eukprot:TRINITY_DN51107_c0_g1_i1.p1 TRINITY_DN51107_c0_g1~~TRINITY_DN51107_c0_g1_i1.p1  ORF type:complete len:264 (-),score=18.82 TRINITY_DN51107_c0_g1_i1:83-874(-)
MSECSSPFSKFRSWFSCGAVPTKNLPESLNNWHLTVEEDADDIADDWECSICLSALYGEKQCVRTRCGHRFHTACIHKNFQVTGRAFCPLCRNTLRGPLAVTARAASGRPIEVLETVPGAGERCHLDRLDRFLMLGDFADRPRMLYLLTSDEDKRTPASRVMWTIDTSIPTKVHLNFRSDDHVSGTGANAWLQQEGWEKSTLRSTVSTGIPGCLYWGPVYSKSFQPGTIRLMGSSCPMGVYFVFIEQLPAAGSNADTGSAMHV